MGLILLRSAFGIVVISEAVANLMNQHGSELLSYAAALSVVVAGLLLIIGLVTPLAALIIILESGTILFSMVPIGEPPSYDSKLCCIFRTIASASLVLLGPGAFSLDARLFGWHEVILPPRPASSGDSASDSEVR